MITAYSVWSRYFTGAEGPWAPTSGHNTLSNMYDSSALVSYCQSSELETLEVAYVDQTIKEMWIFQKDTF